MRQYCAAIRRYRTNGDVTLDALQSALDSLLPLIQEKVNAYYVLNAGDGVVASITICENEEKLEVTNRVIAEWLKQYLASSIVSQEEVQNISSLEVGEQCRVSSRSSPPSPNPSSSAPRWPCCAKRGYYSHGASWSFPTGRA